MFAGSLPPTVEGVSVIEVEVGTAYTFTFHTNYSGNYSAELFSVSLPLGAEFTAVPDSGGDYVLTWTPYNTTEYHIR